jgi:N-methylhydantoinase A/oxoprolinase/acetone carboxylase beta subunit
VILLKYGLGIDAGGTYTDAVIYDFDSEKVISSTKAITNKENLGESINAVLDALEKDKLADIRLVSLSTTLATNSCVEDKGRKVTLVLIGCDSNTVRKFGRTYGLPPIEEIIFVEGEHGSDGSIKTEIDWNLLRTKVLEYRNSTNGFAVVEIGGMYNPEFENQAKKIIEESTGLYTINANTVTRELNFMKRAASALINAQLIPIINEFLDSVKLNLDIRNLRVPLVIVRGDGTLMSEEYTRDVPVETLLSGPAASIVGAIKLSGRKNCIVVDMGGTTSDLALVKDGRVKFAHKGVSIGKWQTGTKSIDMKPIGLGGDSHITFDQNEEIIVSSRRAVPLCYLADKYPNILEEINLIFSEERRNTLSLCEFFFLPKVAQNISMYSKWETPIIEALKNGPLSLNGLSEEVGISKYELRLERLEKHGVIMRSALTPTDIMHLTGQFSRWNSEGARLGAAILAQRLNMNLQELIDTVNKKVQEKLYLNIAGVLLQDENLDFKFEKLSEETVALIMKGFDDKAGCNLNVSVSTDFDLVGIGAPIHIFLPEVAKKLHSRCIVPENASVANAVGAITASVSVEETVIIKPVYEAQGISQYSCFSSEQCSSFPNYEEALDWSRKEAERIALQKAMNRGSGQTKVIVNEEEKTFKPGYFIMEASAENGDQNRSEDKESNAFNKEQQAQSPEGASMLLETYVVARAVGTLKWL